MPLVFTVSAIVTVLSIVAVPVSWVYSIVAQYRLMSYLRKHNYARWRHLNSVIGEWGAELGHNGFRTLPYLFNKQDNDDPGVAALKREVKLSMLYVLCAFMAMMLSLITTARIRTGP